MTVDRFAQEVDLFKEALRQGAESGSRAEEAERDLTELEDASVGIRSWQPLFTLVASLVRERDKELLGQLYSGSTQLHAVIGNELSFRGDAGFSNRAGAPFREGERASVHAVRVLAGLGLALVDPDSGDRPLRNALDWYTDALGSPRTSPWDPRRVDWGQSLRPLMERLADAARDERSAGAALTVAVSLYLLDAGAQASPQDRYGRKAGVTVLLVRGEDGRADLQMSVLKGLPAGLVPDPRQMALFSGDRGFQRSLEEAWALAAPQRIRGTVLWSVRAWDEPVPQIHGESAGAALTVVLDEVKRLSRPLSGLGVLRRLRAKTAIVGRVDELGLLQSVEGYADKFTALPADSRVIVPVADAGRAGDVPGENKEIIAVKNWKEAARKARRPNRKVLLYQAITAAVIVALIAGAVALAAGDQARNERYTAGSDMLAINSEAASGPSSALEALAAWAITPANPLADYSLLSAAANLQWNANLDISGSSEGWVTFSPGGNLLAVRVDDGTRLWDPVHRRELCVIKNDNGTDSDTIAFSPDGKSIAAVDENGIERWSTTAPCKALPALATPQDSYTSVAFSRQGNLVAAGTGDGIRIWNAADENQSVLVHGTDNNQFDGDSIDSVTFSPNGKYLAATTSTRVELWNVSAIWTSHAPRGPAAFLSVGKGGEPKGPPTFSPDSSRFAVAVDSGVSGSAPDTVQIWPTSSAQQPPTVLDVPSGADVHSLEFSPQGGFLAAATSKGVQLWSSRRQGSGYAYAQAINLTPPNGVTAYSATFGRNDHILAAATSKGIWLADPVEDSLRNNPVNTFPTTYGDQVSGLALNPDGSLLAIASATGQVKVVNTSTGQQAVLVNYPPTASGTAVAFSPKGDFLAAATSHSVLLFHTAAIFESRIFETRPAVRLAAAGPLSQITFSPDGRYVAAVAKNSIQVWDTEEPEQAARSLAAPDGKMDLSAAFSPDGKLLAATSDANYDGTIQEWRVGPFSPVASSPPGGSADPDFSAEFSPDSSLLAVGGNGTTQLLDPGTFAPAQPPINASPAAFDPDGLAIGVEAGNGIQLRDLDTGQVVTALPVPVAKPLQIPNILQDSSLGTIPMSFSANGKELAVIAGLSSVDALSSDEVQLWDVSYLGATLGDAASYLCDQLAGQSLSSAEWNQYAPGVPVMKPCLAVAARPGS